MVFHAVMHGPLWFLVQNQAKLTSSKPCFVIWRLGDAVGDSIWAVNYVKTKVKVCDFGTPFDM